MVLPWYKPAIGGVVHGVSKLVERLPSRGFKVTILLQQPDEVPTYINTDDGVEIYGFNTRAPYIPHHGIKSVAAFFLLHRRTVGRLWHFIGTHQIDLVNVHYPSAQYQYFATIRRRYGVPLVVSVHGSDIQFGFNTQPLNRVVYRNLLRGADHITSVSEALLGVMRENVPGLKIPAAAIPGGAVSEYFEARNLPAEQSDRPYILCVARLHPVKGHDLLLKAFRILKDTDTTGCRLILVGSGELEGEIRSQVAALGLENDVQLAGYIPLEGILKLIRNALFTVLTSRSEGLPLTIIEAFAVGRTVVAADVGGVSEIVKDGVTGLLARPGDPEDIALKMQWMLAHPEERAAMETRARELVDSGYTWEANADAYAAIYRKILPKPR
jgi:glycosyltransferase involved in cell wall biosynthesis